MVKQSCPAKSGAPMIIKIGQTSARPRVRYPVLKHPRRFSGLTHYGKTPAELRAGHLPQTFLIKWI